MLSAHVAIRDVYLEVLLNLVVVEIPLAIALHVRVDLSEEHLLTSVDLALVLDHLDDLAILTTTLLRATSALAQVVAMGALYRDSQL